MHQKTTGRSKRFDRVLMGLLAAWVSGACYSYVPLDGPAPVGTEVRARLTTEKALEESELLGVLTQDYEGRVMGVTSDSLMLSVIAARAVGPSHVQTARRTVGLSMTGVAGLEERQLSGVRTAAAVAGGAGVIAALVAGVLTVGGDSGGDGGGSGENAFRSVFGFIWPF
ncbi:MAG: hypothetical protein HKN73_05265 [Gemmatimonadetes bacterium]|nr:hypothetical protein [Gemmatimonadota bacterium]